MFNVSLQKTQHFLSKSAVNVIMLIKGQRSYGIQRFNIQSYMRVFYLNGNVSPTAQEL